MFANVSKIYIRLLKSTCIHHSFSRVISFDDEDLIYGDHIKATTTLTMFDLDYDSGTLSVKSSVEKISITRIVYDVSISSLNPPTVPWRLLCSNTKASFLNTSILVYHARDIKTFIDLCKRYDINNFPGGRTIVDLNRMKSYRTKKIMLDRQDEWIDNITKGLYEGVPIRVIRIRSSNIQCF